jgi:hypothetical protein
LEGTTLLNPAFHIIEAGFAAELVEFLEVLRA